MLSSFTKPSIWNTTKLCLRWGRGSNAGLWLSRKLPDWPVARRAFTLLHCTHSTALRLSRLNQLDGGRKKGQRGTGFPRVILGNHNHKLNYQFGWTVGNSFWRLHQLHGRVTKVTLETIYNVPNQLRLKRRIRKMFFMLKFPWRGTAIVCQEKEYNNPYNQYGWPRYF